MCARAATFVVAWGEGPRRENGGTTSASSADQGRRKRITRPLQQSGHDSPQSGRVYDALHLRIYQRDPREVGGEHDRQPGTRQEALAGTGGKYRAFRGAIRTNQGVACNGATSQRGIRAVGRRHKDFAIEVGTFSRVRTNRAQSRALRLG